MPRHQYKSRKCKVCKNDFTPTSGNSQNCPEHFRKYYNTWSLDYGRRLGKLYHMAKNRANAKELDFNITIEYLIQLWTENQGCCALTGIPFELTHSGKHGQVHPDAPSLDRIRPELGYIKGNVRLVTYHMNVALSEFGVSEFERLVAHYGASK